MAAWPQPLAVVGSVPGACLPSLLQLLPQVQLEREWEGRAQSWRLWGWGQLIHTHTHTHTHTQNPRPSTQDWWETKKGLGEFPGGLVVRVLGFHCHGPGSIIPGGVTEILQAMWHGRKKNSLRKGWGMRVPSLCTDFNPHGQLQHLQGHMDTETHEIKLT